MARDEYSTWARPALLDDQVEAGERGSVGIVCGDTVSGGYPDDVSGRLNICIREKPEPQCGQANREHRQARCAGRDTL